MPSQTEQIAGHVFTLSRDAVCECGIAWAWLKQFGTRERVNETGFAHTGQYTNHECNQVEARALLARKPRTNARSAP